MAAAGLERAWMIGGGKRSGSFLDAGLLTELRIFAIPLLLGDGIPLFSGVYDQRGLKLVKTKSYSSGVVELRYTSRNE